MLVRAFLSLLLIPSLGLAESVSKGEAVGSDPSVTVQVGLNERAEDLESVEQMLKKASFAVQEKNYRGRYTYDAGSGIETLEVIHGVIDGHEHERIYHLNGEKRQFMRMGRPVDCVSAGSFLLRGGLVAQTGGKFGLPKHYHFYIRGDERIAGRMASVIQILPRDRHRYGYILALDKESYLPLLAVTLADSRTAVERFQAVELDVGDYSFGETEATLNSGANAGDETLEFSTTGCGQIQARAGAWQPRWVPPGFVLSQSSEPDQYADSMTYTDGLSSFTVFLKTVEDKDSIRSGAAQKGATAAVLAGGASVNELFQVVLIGEIPAKAAQRVVSSVNLAPL